MADDWGQPEPVLAKNGWWHDVLVRDGKIYFTLTMYMHESQVWSALGEVYDYLPLRAQEIVNGLEYESIDIDYSIDLITGELTVEKK